MIVRVRDVDLYKSRVLYCSRVFLFLVKTISRTRLIFFHIQLLFILSSYRCKMIFQALQLSSRFSIVFTAFWPSKTIDKVVITIISKLRRFSLYRTVFCIAISSPLLSPQDTYHLHKYQISTCPTVVNHKLSRRSIQ